MSGFIDWLENLAGQLEEIADTRTEKKYLGDEDSGDEPEWVRDPSKAPNDRLFWIKTHGYGKCFAAWRTNGDPECPWIVDGRYTHEREPAQYVDSLVTIIHEIKPE